MRNLLGQDKKWSMLRAGCPSGKALSLHHKAPCYASRRGETILSLRAIYLSSLAYSCSQGFSFLINCLYFY